MKARLNNPRVSVVIPAFNAEQWIATTLHSVTNQTFGDWELIVVDDGSTDRTAMIVDTVDDHRVRLIRQENQGPTAARNRGFDDARGDFIALLDADDEYEDRFLERTISFLDEHPSIGLVATNQFLADRNGARSLAFGASAICLLDGDATAVNYCRSRMTERCFPSNTAMVMRTDLVRRLGGYDPTIVGGEEVELLLRWSIGTRIGYIEEPLVIHHDRPGSFIKDLERSINARVHLWRQVIRDDDRYLAALPGYSLLRNMCLFRIGAVAVAAGSFDQADEIAEMWPSAPRDRYWWTGRLLLSLPRMAWKMFHAILRRSDAVRHRNDPAARQAHRNE